MRGREVSRLESFSDAAFGFALTLLVVSIEVPRTFADLVATMRGAPAFAVCFVILVLIWNYHDLFSRDPRHTFWPNESLRSTRRPSFAFLLSVRLTPAVLELDALVINIELTLTSIIQGVALYFLSDNARALLSRNDPAHWLYVVAGLLIILIFWSRSILHTFTLIRWPLEFGHNFFYIACALGEALLFSCLTNPLAWFGLSALYALVVWFLFLYDLRMINPRETDRPREASRRICAVIIRDQLLNIRFLMPALFAFNLFCLFEMRSHPGFFVARQGHTYLIAAQVAGLAFYLYYVVRFFARMAPLIRERQEERRALATLNESETALETARLRQV